MAVIEKWFMQDLQKPVVVHHLDGSLFSHNGNGNRIGVELYNGGEPLESITGTVSGYVVVSDGTTVPCTGAKSGNRASILIPAAAYVPGNVFVSIFVTDDTTVTTVAAMQSTVLQTRTGTQVDPGTVVSDWTDTINAAMQEVETAAENLAGIIATPYASITFPVPLGKYTYHEGGLYRCISPIATSETWTAAHWTSVKLGDDVSNLKSALTHDVLDGYNKYQARYMIYGKAIRVSTGATYTNAAFNCTDFIDLTGCTQIIYSRPMTTASNPSVGMAFYDSTKTYISGISNKGSAAQVGAEYNVVAPPSNAVYARFSWWTDESLETYGIKLPFVVYNYADYLMLNDGNIRCKVLALSIAEGTTITNGKGIRAATGTKETTAAYNCSGYIDVSGASKIVYTRPAIRLSSATFGMAFYDSGKNFISDSGIPNKTDAIETGYEMYECDVPSGAVYARFSWWNDELKALYNITCDLEVYNSSDYAGSLQNEIESIKQSVQNDYPHNALGLHTQPENIGVLNVIKRCRQITDFKWTPQKDLTRAMMVSQSPPYDKPVDIYEGVFNEGVEYTGLPYGNTTNYKIDNVSIQTRYKRKTFYIGLDIGFDAFATSVVNPNSMICEKSIHRTSPHQALAYAVVCSSLACYALNVPFKETQDIPNISGLIEIGNIIDNGTRMDINSTLKLGDVINQRYHHVSIVTDIIRNVNNEIQFIEISEATVVGNGNQAVNGGQYGGVARRLAFTVDDFFYRYGEYTLYRYSYISSVPYTKSPWVNVGDELPMNPLIDLPCMPYEGEGFVYIEGYIPFHKILIACHDYSYLRVFKDGTEISGSPFAVSASDDYITVNFSAVGEYSAYLCNMSNGADTAVTATCHWSVIADS